MFTQSCLTLLQPRRLQSARLLSPWDFPGRNTLPFPPPGDLPNPETELGSPALAGRVFTTEPPGQLATVLRNPQQTGTKLLSLAGLLGDTGNPYWPCSLDTLLNSFQSQLLAVKWCKSGPSSVVLRLWCYHQGRTLSGSY